MTTILIVCGAGASSTFLASRMRALASSDGHTLDVTPTSDDRYLDRLGDVDAVLVAPHLAPSFEALDSAARSVGVPAALLPGSTFGPTGARDALALAYGMLGLASSVPTTAPTPEGTDHA